MPVSASRLKFLAAFTSVLTLLAPLAHGLGLGPPQVHASLGQALNVSFALTLAPNELLPENCLRADVSAGEARVPAGLLQLRLEGEAGQPPSRVRLSSLVRIDESPLQLSLSLGCPSRFTRDYVIAMEPAGRAPVPAPTLAGPVAEPTAVLQVLPARETAPRATPAASPKPALARRVVPKRAAQPRLSLEAPEILVAAPGAAAASAPASEADLEATVARLELLVAQLQADLRTRQPVTGAAIEPATAVPASETASVPAAAAVAVAEAASQAASQAAEPAASDAIPEMFTPPAVRAQRSARYANPLTWLWTLALSLSAGALAYYWSRWRDERRRRERAYWRAMAANEAAAAPQALARAALAPEAPSEVVLPVSAPAPFSHADSTIVSFAPAVRSGAVALPNEGQSASAPPVAWPPTAPLPVLVPTTATPPAPVPGFGAVAAIDTLLDLQQQVEFLSLLGQQDAVADLLTGRVQQDSGGPMPYLMLMELCQQRGEPEAFAELARRFELRFGGQPATWLSSLARGRSLDTSPSVIAHLQVVWADPAQAMQMLRDLVARGGGPGASSFELPAYRDLLLLYSVARDLFEENERGEGVDFMLPMDSRL